MWKKNRNKQTKYTINERKTFFFLLVVDNQQQTQSTEMNTRERKRTKENKKEPDANFIKIIFWWQEF